MNGHFKERILEYVMSCVGRGGGEEAKETYGGRLKRWRQFQ